MEGKCRQLSGTSVASPVVAGAVTLLARLVFLYFFNLLMTLKYVNVQMNND